MYLKSLKLVGFKSFADRTHLELRSGVTVVVGPNGSGKSNLVDALSWVMGTQSVKALRTGKMEDVVFAGTATRPALNRAEVTLIIDNAERRLALDLDEVSLTRRLYRDGSSDYEINGVGCRLLDIQELLSDSGVGRHQHVIIGQGEIGKVLSASPEEHRAVIEEAAGILKHRKRKEKAERRLERTDDDLARLQDLVGEIERQMRPLKRQARAAERYDGLKAEVKALALYLAREALSANETESAGLVSEQQILEARLEEDETRVVGLSARLDALTESASVIGSQLERDTAAAARLETTTERLKRMGSIANERRRAASDRRDVAVQRSEDLDAERSEISEELVVVSRDESTTAGLASEREQEFRRLEDEERAIATQTSLSPEGAVAAVRGELSVLEAAETRDARETEAVEERLRVLTGQLRDETAEIDSINAEIRELDGRVSAASDAYEQSLTRREADQSVWSAAEAGLSEARLREAAASARVEAVTAALEGRFDIDARRAIEDSDGALGSLISVLDVPEGLEKAVEVALGPWVDSVAFDGVESMQIAVEAVKAGGGGGVPVVSAISPISATAPEVASAAGVESLIDRLGPSADAGLASRLLGDVLLVEGWSAAWTLVSRHPALRAVTPEGDLISVNGVRIAHPDGAGPAMLEAAEVALEKAETELARTVSIHTSAQRDFEKSREDERQALEFLEKIEASLAGKTEAMARLQKSVDAHTVERDRLDERKRSLVDGATERQRQTRQLRQRLEALEGEEAARMKVWEEMEARRLELAASREMARSEWQEVATRYRAIRERRSLLEERVSRIDAELQSLTRGVTKATDMAPLEAVAEMAQRAVDSIRGRLEELRERQAVERERHGQTLTELEEVRSDYEATRSRIATDKERLGHIQLRLTELRMKRESVIESVRRDADSGIDEAMGASRPDHPEDVDLDALLEEKAARLRRLGPINPLAAAEFAEMSERHTFITEQLADVESSRAELRKVIAALDEEIEMRFQEAFAEVAEAYQRYFGILFPGGKGRIRLTDPDDPQAGLLIDAQPLGKKVSQMTLLSGGERSLAALAFLFSVFEARPSPFYVLDEVEAALDDANLRRFLRIVEEFRQRAQLIIITHQQHTMEAADVLYGVTMEPGGSSQVVRKDMSPATVDQVA